MTLEKPVKLTFSELKWWSSVVLVAVTAEVCGDLVTAAFD